MWLSSKVLASRVNSFWLKRQHSSALKMDLLEERKPDISSGKWYGKPVVRKERGKQLWKDTVNIHLNLSAGIKGCFSLLRQYLSMHLNFCLLVFCLFVLFCLFFVLFWRTSILLNFSEITIFPFQLKRGIGIADVKQKEGPEALR